jgi:hypothetical protein
VKAMVSTRYTRERDTGVQYETMKLQRNLVATI